MDSKTLRNKRENFRSKHDHKHLPEVSLVASKESTAMFNVAGMQQLVPYLAGKTHPIGNRLFNIQKCIRTVDIDEVGDSSHLTFFEMMGNRSLGDYFKKESVKYSYDFLVNELGFDTKKLAVTVFEGNKDAPRDEETAKYRKEVGIPDDKISFMGAKDNRRSPGPVGPCGPDTEIFYRTGEGFPSKKDNVKAGEENRMEIRNNVFMEYYRNEDGKLTKLKNQNVDTGMGFERMCMVLQNKETVFQTDLFQPIIDLLEKYTDLKYQDHKRRFRIVVDHLRTAILLLNDGVIQSNIGSGYVLRMIIRRMYYNLILLKDISIEDFGNLAKEAINHFDHIRKLDTGLVIKSLLDEVELFKKTISKGMKELESRLPKNKGEILEGKDVFFLYDTCGFPIELTREIAEEKGFKIDEEGFRKELEAQKERSRKSTKFQKDIDRSKHLEGIPPTEFIGYDLNNYENSLSSGAKSKDLEFSDINLLKDFEVNGQKVLIFDKTPFYAESGGQKGDSGEIELDSGEIVKIKDVQKYEGVFLHLVK
ncbi:MAG TPA: alanine--tRNA ligase-related protein [Candidatus Absconditabacterales bacterium]|nr:alanine--tRNA ligase-related protein [Candidatus Absconditabacterales bacterium]